MHEEFAVKGSALFLFSAQWWGLCWATILVNISQSAQRTASGKGDCHEQKAGTALQTSL